MNIPRSFFRRSARASRAFSLVEVTLAIGIVAFAFIALFGLVPTGLNVFRSAIDASVGTQILNQVVQAAQQTDFEALIQPDTAINNYYDEQANLLLDDQGAAIVATNDPRAIYTVHVSATVPTTVPSAAGTSATANLTYNVAKLTVKIAKDPGHNPTPFADSNKANFNTFIAYVARNKSAFESK